LACPGPGADQVQVFIHEVAADGWAKGGKLAADRDA
jgi:phenylpyruvate tautomerase PptA (4-oxalocrotonate tautomerase family)